MSAEHRNLTFEFVNNTAQNSGSAIFSVSFYSCFFACHRDLKRYKLENFRDCIGTFVFNDSPDNSTALATRGTRYKYTSNKPLTAIPGQILTIPISISNEFKHPTLSLIIVKKQGDKQSSGAIFAHNVTRVFGEPHETNNLTFQAQNSLRVSIYSILITFLDCPPGYYFHSSTGSCNCTADNAKYSYYPIVRCNHTTFRAFILRGYWAGLYNGKLRVSSFSKVDSFARHKIPTGGNRTTMYELPQTSAELNGFMCGENRHGVLCAKCNKNRSVYYHSRSHKCGLKNIGSLFYILTELIPIVITFSIIILLIQRQLPVWLPQWSRPVLSGGGHSCDRVE